MNAIELSALSAPLKPNELEWRIGQSGNSNGKVWAQILCYVTNRAVQDRFDAVCGPGRWRNEFREWNVGGKAGILCGISVLIGDSWVTKWDGSDPSDVEPIKGGLSDAMKRAAVQWGFGRYLYSLGETWADCSPNKQEGWDRAKTKDGTVFYWKAPDNVMHYLADAYQNTAKKQPAPAVDEPPPAAEPAKAKAMPLPGMKIAEALSKIAFETKLDWRPQEFLTAAGAPHADGSKTPWLTSDFTLACNWTTEAHVEDVLSALRNWLIKQRKEKSQTAA